MQTSNAHSELSCSAFALERPLVIRSYWREVRQAGLGQQVRLLHCSKGFSRLNLSASMSATTSPSTDAPIGTRQDRSTLRAVVIGAGPAGSVSAANLARRGYHVEVFEKRSAPTAAQAASRRSYPMLISGRSLRALERSGLKPKFLEQTPFDGMVSLTRGITMRFTKTRQHIVHRVQLAIDLINAAEKAYPGQICYHFHHDLSQVNFTAQEAKFVGPAGQPQGTFGYDLLIGADGANSHVRDLLHEADQRLQYEVICKAKSSYKTFHDLPPLPKDCHFSEGFDNHNPGQHMYMALAKGKDAKVGTIAMWKNTAGNMCGMAALNHWEDWGHTPEELSSSQLPIPQPWLDAIGQQFDQQDFNNFGRIIKCTRICGHRTALVGDAAHAVTSVLGQGCNTALSTCTALDKALGACDATSTEQLNAALDQYNDDWLPQAHALQQLEYMSAMARQPADRVTDNPLKAYAVKALMTSSMLASLALNKLNSARFPNAFGTIQELQDPSINYTALLDRVYLRACAFAFAVVAVLSGVGWVVNYQLLHWT